jgi:hypothetical protein
MISDFSTNPVFICGHPKAGTSLLTSLLDGHPALVVYPEETLFFRRFLPASEDKSADEKLALADELLIQIFQWNQEAPPEHQKDFTDRDYSTIDFDQVHQILKEYVHREGATDKDYLEGAVNAFGEVSGSLTDKSRYWVEKSPYNEFYTEQIFNKWPEAKCIHIVRDPRDNYASYKVKHPSWTVKTFAKNWNRSTKTGLANQKAFGKDRYHIVRFEDLLRNPESETRNLAEFLNLEWDEALLQPTRVGAKWAGNSMFALTYKSISTDPIGRWKTKTSLSDLAILQTIAHKLMGEMGYAQEKIPMQAINRKDRLRILREKLIAWLRPD